MLKRNHLTQCDLVSRQGDLISSGPGCDLTVNYVSSAAAGEPTSHEQRAEQLLANLLSGYYEHTYATCIRCQHSELAHNRTGCEATTDDGAPCECRRVA